MKHEPIVKLCWCGVPVAKHVADAEAIERDIGGGKVTKAKAAKKRAKKKDEIEELGG